MQGVISPYPVVLLRCLPSPRYALLLAVLLIVYGLALAVILLARRYGEPVAGNAYLAALRRFVPLSTTCSMTAERSRWHLGPPLASVTTSPAKSALRRNNCCIKFANTALPPCWTHRNHPLRGVRRPL